MIFNLTYAVQTRRLLSLGICLIGLGIWPHLCEAKPPSSVFGKYAGIGCPTKGKADSCLPTKATDSIRILAAKDADAIVGIRIVFDRGHLCILEGRADWSDGRFTLHAEGLDPNKPCQLVLRVSGSVLTLEDQGGFCREVYCGVRGAFDGARFRKRP